MTASKLETRARAAPGRLLVRALGVALSVLGIGFTVLVILENDALARFSWDARLWLPLALAWAAYAVLSVLLVVVWASVLDVFAPGCLGARDAYVLYATTQVMKYIPSNVVHFVGRHVALRRRGVPHLALVATVFGEAAVLVCGACLAILALGPDLLSAAGERGLRAEGLPLAAAVGLTLCLGAALSSMGCASLRGLVSAGIRRRLVSRLPLAMAAAAAFFAATSLLIATLCRFLLGDPAGLAAAAVAAALAGAWIVGFVVPGASAGIGVREAAVILLLSPAVGAADAAAIAAIYRVVTAGGDALLAGLGELARRLGATAADDGGEPARSEP